MSASAEELFEQILVLHEKINSHKFSGLSTVALEAQLIELNERLQLMNEGLKNSQKVLKG